MSKPFIEPPLRGYGIMGKVTLGDGVLKVLRLDGARSIEDAAIRSMLDEPSREVWDHDGVCSCGKETYLFSRCPSCIQAEALETTAEIVCRQDAAADPPDDGVGIEVGSTLALLCPDAGDPARSAQGTEFRLSPGARVRLPGGSPARGTQRDRGTAEVRACSCAGPSGTE